MVLRSRWIGFDETTLEPLKGEYFSILAPDSVPGHYSANIPRQNDTSLALEFWTADPKKGGRMLTSYRLGEFMTRAGYDWKMPHLPPFHFELNYANARLTIQVNDWREQIAIDIKI